MSRLAIRKVVVCDQCGSDDGVRKWRMGISGRSFYTLELCSGCSEPVAKLVAAHEARKPRAATFKVTPIEQIEGKPAKTRKTAQKRTPPSREARAQF